MRSIRFCGSGVTKLSTILLAVVVGHSVTAAPQTPGSASPVIEAVRERVEALSAGGELSVEGTSLSATRSIAALYELHGFEPFWDSVRLTKLLDIVRASTADGLTPADYHLAALERLSGRVDRTALETAQLDLLATDAFTELLYHLYFGKVDPVSIDSRWNFERRELKDSDALQFVFAALTSDRYLECDRCGPSGSLDVSDLHGRAGLLSTDRSGRWLAHHRRRTHVAPRRDGSARRRSSPPSVGKWR